MSASLELDRLQDTVRQAFAQRRRLNVRGGGSSAAWYGPPRDAEILEVGGYCGIVTYDPSELVATVRCGTPLAELETELERHSQMLGSEPPHFGPHATVGGRIAAGFSGPRAASVGPVRDAVLGARILDGQGRLLTFGGQVMKNVAGYDVSRLMVGSRGSLGIIVELSLRVLPRPQAQLSVVLSLTEQQALQQLSAWRPKALPIAATAWVDGNLYLRLEGLQASVRVAAQALGGEQFDGASAVAFWRGLKEQTTEFFTLRQAAEERIWRLTVPAHLYLNIPGAGLFEAGGAVRWCRTSADPATMHRLARSVGGQAVLFKGKWMEGGFPSLPPALQAIHTRIRRVFDPAGIFSDEPSHLSQET